MTERGIGIYIRASSNQQKLRSQRPDLLAWAKAFAGDQPVLWFDDKFTGHSMERPGWETLHAEVRAGRISRIVVWRLDRLGRTAAGVTALLEELRALKVGLVSVREGFDFDTPSGRMMAVMLASFSQFESEVRQERQAAGIAAALAEGKRWGGKPKGKRNKATMAKARQIRKLFDADESIASIARTVGLSRPTVYSLLG